MRPVSLSTRFAVTVAVLVPVLVLLAGLLMLRLAANDLRSERDHRLTSKAQALIPLATNYVRLADRRGSPLSQLENSASRLAAASVGASASDGLYIAAPNADALPIGNVPDAASLPLQGNGPGTFVAASGKSWRFVATDLGVRGRAGRLWVLEPDSRLTSRVDLLRERLLLATFLAIGVGAAAGFGLGRIAVRPLTRLRGQAQRIDTRPYGPYDGERLTTGSGVIEIDELAQLLNRLLDRRDAAVAETGAALETARAFAATAAHELRTPLTSMGANLSMLGHPGLTPGQLDELIADLTTEHARMQGLITVLRQLARGELVDPSGYTEVDLAELADAAAEDARRRHPDAAITVALADGACIRGWAEGLRMIVDNLLDNAAIHGADGTRHAQISISVRRAAGQAVLAVDDAGPGIPPEQRQAVFDRFHRRRDSPGSGLGLTLVHQQATLHRGTVQISTSPPGGTRVELRLPLDPAALNPTMPIDTRSWLSDGTGDVPHAAWSASDPG